MFTLKKINDIKVIPFNIPKVDPKKIKGYDMIPEIYANIYLVAHKKSGKTTCIFNMLKQCADKDTTLIFFGSTIFNDPGYKEIFKYFKRKKNPILKLSSIVEDGVDKLQEILSLLKGIEDESDDENKEKKEEIKYISVNDSDDENKKEKKKKKKRITPDIIFIFDDLSKTMRTSSFTQLLKTNRHYKCKTITSSQNVKDIMPDARENIDFLILFKDINDKLLETIYEDFNIKLEYYKFKTIYKDATSNKHSFLYINTREHKYRKNFNEEYMFEN